jgi:hypothetical protein
MPMRSRWRRSGSTTEVDAINDARLWYPWLHINRALRVILHTRCSSEAWSQVRVELTKALGLRSQIRRAGWFN